jgi:hypothetical protein
MKYLILLIFILSTPVQAEELKPADDIELTHILSRLVVVHDPVHFEEQGYSVKFYGVDFGGHCAEAQYCRGLVELLIVTTEMGDEGPVSNLYRLPKKHIWTVHKWEHLKSGKQGIYLKATTFENNQPNAQSTEEEFLLTTTWLKVELKAL